MPLCTESRWTTSAEQTDPRNGRLKRKNLTHRHARGLDEASPPLSLAEKECHACVTLLSCLSKHLSLRTSRCTSRCAVRHLLKRR